MGNAHPTTTLHMVKIFGDWDLGSGRVSNRLEMAVSFKWTDSQPISIHMGPFGIDSGDLMLLPSTGDC